MNSHGNPIEEGPGNGLSTTIQNDKAPAEDGGQFLLRGFSLEVDEKGATHELEWKHVFPFDDLNQDVLALSQHVESHMTSRNPRLVKFKGTDYNYMIRGNGKLLTARFRTGAPKHNLLCFKLRGRRRGTARKEIEFKSERRRGLPNDEADELLIEHTEIAFEMMAAVAERSLKVDFLVEGDIRFVAAGDLPGHLIEVVVYTARGIGKYLGRNFLIGEIEAHHFNPRTEIQLAKQHMREWQKLLGWAKFRSKESMAELVSGRKF